MNILFLSHKFDPSNGGVEKVTNNLTVEFQKRHHKVFFLQISNEYRNREIKDQLYVINEPIGDKVSKRGHEYIKEIINTNKISIIINQVPYFNRSIEIISHIKHSHYNVKIISVFHSTPNCYMYMAKYYFRHLSLSNFKHALGALKRQTILNKRLIAAHRYSDYLCLLSEQYKQDLYKLVGNSNKITAINNPLPFIPKKVSFNQKKNKVLFVGRLNSPEKNLFELIQIWEKLNTQNWELEIIGDDSNIQEIKRYVNTHNISSISFIGHQKNLTEYYTHAKLICMTSIYEGWGMVLAEAQSYGCVPIVYDSFGAAKEILNYGKAGVLIPSGNQEKFRVGLLDLMANPNLLAQYQREAIKISQKWYVEYVVNKWEEIFNE